MRIKLSKLSLQNFKGIKSLTIDFGDFTTIAGANATGKSTIADAFTWLLFGKDTTDRKDFEIKTLNSKGVVIPRIDHEVTGVLLIDGVVVNLKRTLTEKWVKQRGSSEQVFTGNETLYFINDVPKSQKEYQDYINQVVPEATFKLLTSPTYFNSIKWQDRRAMLTAIATVPDDETIAGKDLAGVLKIMRDEKKSLSDLKKEYAAKKTKIKATLDLIPARLDEVNRSTPEAKDFTAIEKEIEEAKKAIANCDTQINDMSKGVQEQVKVRSNAIRYKGELENAIGALELHSKKVFAEQAGMKDNAIATLKQQITFRQSQVVTLTNGITEYQNAIARLNTLNDGLRKEFTSIKDVQFDAQGVVDTCPTCHQQLPEGDIEAQRETMLANFNQDKAGKIAEINRKGIVNKNAIGAGETRIAELKSQIVTLDAEIINIKHLVTDKTAEPSHLTSVEAILAGNPDYIKYQKQLSEIVIPEITPVDASDLQMVKSDIQSELETLQQQLNSKAIIEAMNTRRDELLKEEETLSQELAQMEGFEFQITEFTNRKMKAVEDSVNTMFPTVRFKMFDVQINGGIAETCETLVNGIPFTDANNAGRINAGLEIISVFSKVNDIYAPVFVDNAESCNHLFSMESQLIALYVTEDKKLKINVESISSVA